MTRSWSATRWTFVREAADRVAFMHAGAILETAAPEDFFQAPRSEEARRFVRTVLGQADFDRTEGGMNRRDFIAAAGLVSGLALAAAPALATGVARQHAGRDQEARPWCASACARTCPGFGIVDDKGATVGFDIDIATELAARLGVKVELVPVTAATRIPLLQQRPQST